jgi:hypothetical protein
MIMEPVMATAAEATDMLSVGHRAVYRLIAARQRDGAAEQSQSRGLEGSRIGRDRGQRVGRDLAGLEEDAQSSYLYELRECVANAGQASLGRYPP